MASTKFQAPNNKQIPITEIQMTEIPGFWSFGHSNFEFVWNLEFVI